MRGRNGKSATRAAADCLIFASALVSVLAFAACTSYYEVPIEVPVSAKLDVANYGRVLVAGFTTQTTEDLDLGAETTRLLRNQLRNTSNLNVIDAELEPLGDFSEESLERSGKLDEFEELEEQAKAAGSEDISEQEWIDKLLAAGFSDVQVTAYDAEMSEGAGHDGMSALVDLVARR